MRTTLAGLVGIRKSLTEAAMNLGADGVQIGSKFIASIESSAHENFKNAVVNARADGPARSAIPPVNAAVLPAPISGSTQLLK